MDATDDQRRRADQPRAGHHLLPHLPAHPDARHHRQEQSSKHEVHRRVLAAAPRRQRPAPRHRRVGRAGRARLHRLRTDRPDHRPRRHPQPARWSPSASSPRRPASSGSPSPTTPAGCRREPHFGLRTDDTHPVTVDVTGRQRDADHRRADRAGRARSTAWRVDFLHGDRLLTASTARSVGVVTDAEGRRLRARAARARRRRAVYGLGERFGPFVKNGQTVDIWNADGGTASEQAYKNVPFYLTSPATACSSTTRSTCRSRSAPRRSSRDPVQRRRASARRTSSSTGPTPKDVLRTLHRADRPPGRVSPAWSFGLWLSTSFTTAYDEETVTEFIDGMAERDLPLSASSTSTASGCASSTGATSSGTRATFPDPEGMLRRLHERGLRVCVWINPYIAQRSPLFEEGRAGRLPGAQRRTAASGSGTSGRPAWRWSTSPTRTRRAGSPAS